MGKANYNIVEETNELVCIRDLGPWDTYQTVTNAAEEVVKELAEYLNGRRLLYIDSENQKDELLHKDNKFIGFNVL